MPRILGSLLLVGCLVLGTPAAESRPVHEGPGLLPLLNDQTLVVIGFDLQRVDGSTLRKQLIDPLVETDEARAKAREFFGILQDWSQRLRTSQGGGQCYLVWMRPELEHHLIDEEHATELLRSLCLVLPPGLDEAQLADVRTLVAAQRLLTLEPDHKLVLAEVHGLQVVASQSWIDRLNSRHLSPRPEFVAALQAVEGDALQIVVVPPPAVTRALPEIWFAPFRPGERPVGQVLADGVRWLALGWNPSPEPSPARLVVQSRDEKSARELQQVLAELGSYFTDERQETQRDSDLVKRLRGILNGHDLAIRASLGPKLEKDRLRFTLDKQNAPVLLDFHREVIRSTTEALSRQIGFVP